MRVVDLSGHAQYWGGYWRPFVGAELGEDVVVGLLCGAAGLRMRSLVGPGEPFGLSYRGLPMSCEELLRGGWGIVHSVKDHGPYQEADTRAFFRGVRAQHTVPSPSLQERLPVLDGL